MKAARSLAALAVVMLAASGAISARAQECVDWSQSPSLPQYYPELAASYCVLKGHVAYTAGDEFRIIDVSDIHAPQTLGSIALPGPAGAMVVAGDRACLICDGVGLVAINVSDPANPIIHGPRGEGRTFTALGTFGPYVLAVEQATKIHVLAPNLDGGLTLKHSVPILETEILAVGEANGYLIVLGEFGVYSYDGTNPEQPFLRDILGGTLYSAQGFAISGSTVYVVEYAPNFYCFEPKCTLLKCEVQPDGTLSVDIVDGSRRIISPFVTYATEAMVAVGYAASSGNVFDCFDAQTLSRMTVLSGYGKGALGGDRLLSVHDGGLSITDISHANYTAPEVELASVRDLEYLGSYVTPYGRGSAAGDYVLAVEGQEISGCDFLDGDSVLETFTIYGIEDPLTPRLITTGSSSHGCSDEYCGVSGYRLSGIVGDRMVVNYVEHHTSGTVTTFRFYSMETGLQYPALTTQSSIEFAGDALWENGPGTLIRYDVDVADPSVPTAVFPMSTGIGRLISPGAGILIKSLPGGFEVYDSSDPLSLNLLANCVGVPYVSSSYQWSGARLIYPVAGVLYVVDFSDPARPYLASQTVLPGSYVRSLNLEGDRLAISYSWDPSGVQVYSIGPQGGIEAVTGVIQADYLSPVDAVATDTMVYVGSGSTIFAYDISDPAVPEYAGMAFYGQGTMTLRGDYLLSGALIYRRDCRDFGIPCEAAQAPLCLSTNEGMDGAGSDSIRTLLTGKGHGSRPMDWSLAPNPFNPATDICFTLDGPRTVRIEVFDVRGREVARIAEGAFPAGDHRVTWQGQDKSGRSVPTGVYFIRLQVGDQVTVKKAMLLK